MQEDLFIQVLRLLGKLSLSLCVCREQACSLQGEVLFLYPPAPTLVATSLPATLLPPEVREWAGDCTVGSVAGRSGLLTGLQEAFKTQEEIREWASGYIVCSLAGRSGLPARLYVRQPPPLLCIAGG